MILPTPPSRRESPLTDAGLGLALSGWLRLAWDNGGLRDLGQGKAVPAQASRIQVEKLFSARAEAVTSGWETSSRFAPCWRERAGSGLFLSYSALQMGKETPGPEEVLVLALYPVRVETSPLHSPGSSGR